MSWKTGRPNTPRLSGRARQQRNAQVMAEHNGRCHLCGRLGATEIDHVIPLAEGGADTRPNLLPAHTDCHAEKTKRESIRGALRTRRQRPKPAHPGLRSGGGPLGRQDTDGGAGSGSGSVGFGVSEGERP